MCVKSSDQVNNVPLYRIWNPFIYDMHTCNHMATMTPLYNRWLVNEVVIFVKLRSVVRACLVMTALSMWLDSPLSVCTAAELRCAHAAYPSAWVAGNSNKCHFTPKWLRTPFPVLSCVLVVLTNGNQCRVSVPNNERASASVLKCLLLGISVNACFRCDQKYNRIHNTYVHEVFLVIWQCFSCLQWSPPQTWNLKF